MKSTKTGRLYDLIKDNEQIEPKNFHKLLLYYGKALSADALKFWERGRYDDAIRQYEHPHPPVFVLGHWRSGTSYLQSVMGEAGGYVYYNKFQTFFPDSFLLTRKSLKAFLNFLFMKSPFAKSWNSGFAHNFESLDTASEIEVAQTTAINDHTFHWAYLFPKNWKYYFDKYLFLDDISSEEYNEWLDSVQYFNKKVNYTEPGSRLIVKNPGDTARLRHILKIYPNAKFIFLHRNPYDVFYSNIKLWRKVLGNLSLQETGELNIRKNVLYIYRRLHENYLRDKELLKPEQLVEVDFSLLRTDTLSALEKIYDHLDLPGFTENTARFESYIEEHEQKVTRYEYDPNDVEAIDKEWDEMFREYSYPGV